MEKEAELITVWRERLQAQQSSGLSVAAWSKQAGVSAWSVYAWRKRLGPRPAAAKLVALPMAAMAPGPLLEMQTPSGYVLRLSSAEQVSWLPAILAAVR